MKLQALYESDNVSLIAKLLTKLLKDGAFVWLDFKYRANEASRGYFPLTDIYGHLEKIEPSTEPGEFKLSYYGQGRVGTKHEDDLYPGETFILTPDMDDLLTVKNTHEQTVSGQDRYEVVRQEPMQESEKEKTLLWRIISKKLKNDDPDADVDIEFNVPYKLLAKHGVMTSAYAGRSGNLKGKVIGALKGNRINVLRHNTLAQAQLELTPALDDVLEFKKPHDGEESYIIRPL